MTGGLKPIAQRTNLTLSENQKSHFGRKALYFCHYVRSVVLDVRTFPKFCKPLVVYRFYDMALYDTQTRRHVIKHVVFL